MKTLPFNACDYRCERCLVTEKCAVFLKLRDYSLLEELRDRPVDELSVVLDAIRESFVETERIIKEKAKEFGIDINELAGGDTADEIREHHARVTKDGLYLRSLEFTGAVHRFLQDASPFPEEARDSVEDIVWHHTVIPAKLFRALAWTPGNDEMDFDRRNSAAVALKSLAICIMALDYLASNHPAVRLECERLSGAGTSIKHEIGERFSLRKRV
jgi:hypothetical protein